MASFVMDVYAADTKKIWFRGSILEAFKKAKKDKKPMFLYWGAVWCPSCNEVKNQVFNHPRFRHLMSDVVPVYLDGDSVAAQEWGEQLKVAAYPTLLLLNEMGQEVLRIAEAVNIYEFERAFRSARAIKEPIRKLIATAITGKASVAAWYALAYAHWDEVNQGREFTDLEKLQLSWELYKKTPGELKEVKALFATKLLLEASSNKPRERKMDTTALHILLKTVGQKAFQILISSVFNEPNSINACRSTIVFKADEILTWLRPFLSKDEVPLLAKKWEEAVLILRNNASHSADTRLWASYVPIELFRFSKGKKARIPLQLYKQVKDAVAIGDKESKTASERQAVISGAAYLLQQIKEWDNAESLLTKELKTSLAPWYYYLALARLEERRGRKNQALIWSRKSWQSVRGTATKIQYLVSDLLISLRLAPENIQLQVQGLKRYYNAVFSVKDGFLGRNKLRALKLAKAFGGQAKTKEIQRLVSSYAPRCEQINEKMQPTCRQHFRFFLDEKNRVL